MIILIPPRTSQPELGVLSALHSHSLIKTQSQATNSNKPSTSSLKEGRVGWWGVQITVGLSASTSVRDTWNRNPASNHFLCKKGYFKKNHWIWWFFFFYIHNEKGHSLIKTIRIMECQVGFGWRVPRLFLIALEKWLSAHFSSHCSLGVVQS